MNQKENSLLQLEEQMTSVENNALAEERINARNNFAYLQMAYDSIPIPYPDVLPDTTGMDYADISDIQFKKSHNKRAWAEQSELLEYMRCPQLYKGHLRTIFNLSYFFMDSATLRSRTLQCHDHTIHLINADDKQYMQFVQMWLYPAQHKEASYSRNIEMHNQHVSAVDVIYDRSNELLSEITDAYLRKALARNKEFAGMRSIIQTIQQKQNSIRLLPAHRSFIVQGCAGSGKTMVLLHRLRYLLFNKAIDGNDYFLLVPSHHFKSFVKDLAEKFQIRFQNILPIQTYYQLLMEKTETDQTDDVSELVFDKHYLARVYSKDFLVECYQELFGLLSAQVNKLIEFCETKLNGFIEKEELLLTHKASQIANDMLTEAKSIVLPLQSHINVDLQTEQDLDDLIKQLSATLQKAKQEYDKVAIPVHDIVISPDDERLLANPQLVQIKAEVESERIQVHKASIFTVLAHKNKLAKLEEQYKTIYATIENELIAAEKEAYAERAARLHIVYDGVTIDDLQQFIDRLSATKAASQCQIDEITHTKQNLTEHLSNKYEREISLLNLLIEASSATEAYHRSIHSLKPCYKLFRQTIQIARDLISCFASRLTDDEVEEAISRLKLFTPRSNAQLDAYLNMTLFNICRQRIKDEFGLKINKLYKHYWYLAVYCQYLTSEKKRVQKHYLFIDEAQDLSVSELELIFKINTAYTSHGEINSVEEPVLNIFGDVNQMITDHGISAWSSLTFIDHQFTLEENFRNTNQIVDFCNQKLTMQMQKVGVDMDEVQEYASLESYLDSKGSFNSQSVYIVKNAYAKTDLSHLLGEMTITEPTIYTVKAAKGLEFKEIIVFDRDMSENERYIAYTRTLAKLTVIHTLPRFVSPDEILYIEGDELDEND